MPAPLRAFTLVELSVALAIAAVVLVAGVPAFIQLRAYAQTRSASHLLSTSLASARMLAVAQGVPYSVCPTGPEGQCRQDGVWDQGWMVFRDAARGEQPRHRADVVAVEHPAGGVRVRSTAGRHQARFLPMGHAPGSNLTLIVCSGRRGLDGARVVMGNSGRVRTERLPPGHPDCPGA
jgi:type IV fimbrial biogenesis protein FimT